MQLDNVNLPTRNEHKQLSKKESSFTFVQRATGHYTKSKGRARLKRDAEQKQRESH